MSILSLIKGKQSQAVASTEHQSEATVNTNFQAASDNFTAQHAKRSIGKAGSVLDMSSAMYDYLDNQSAAKQRGRNYGGSFPQEVKSTLRQLIEQPRTAVDYAPPAVPRFREFLDLDLESFRDQESRRSTVEGIEHHYMQVEAEILAGIADAKAKTKSPNMTEVKLYSKIEKILKEQLFKLQREIAQLDTYREQNL